MAKKNRKQAAGFDRGILKMDAARIAARQGSFQSSQGTKFDSRPHRERTRGAENRAAIMRGLA